MKQFALFAALLLSISMLAGCGTRQQNPSGDTSLPPSSAQAESADPVSSVASAASDRPTESSGSPASADPVELASLRENMTACNCMLGVGFFGYIDSEIGETAVRKLVGSSVLAVNYPFLNDCTPVLLDGAELYAFVPADHNVAVTVYPTDISEDGTYIDHRDTPIYQGKPGEIVTLRCNLSEVYANVLILASDGTNTIAFHPTISMESGCLIQERGCYDFSVYAQGGADPVELARVRLAETDEVRDALARGMQLRCTGDTQTIEGRSCLLFALGTDHADQFVREALYAVSDDLIYAFSTEDDRWEPLGAG